MGQYYESLLRQGAPTAAITTAMFQKRDRPIMLAGPAAPRNAPAVLIDQHHGSGLDDRRHRPVLEANKAIPAMSNIHPCQEIQWHFSPATYEMTEKCGLVQVDIPVGRLRSHGRAIGRKADHVGFV